MAKEARIAQNMDTRIYRLQGTDEDNKAYEEAGEIIRRGGLVAFPTETVYGLGGNALDPEASRKIYAAKGRPSDNPLILHISGFDELAPLVRSVPECARKLMDEFWPGPMTLIFEKSGLVPRETTGGLDTVAVRMPSHEAARKLIGAAGVPIAAPSANISGKPSPTCAEHVREDMDGRIDMILDGGDVEIGLESTIIDVTGDEPLVLRPGYIGLDVIRRVAGGGEIDPAILGVPDPGMHPKAPGMKYRHYAPKADITIVRAPEFIEADTIGIIEAGTTEAKTATVRAAEAKTATVKAVEAKTATVRAAEAKAATVKAVEAKTTKARTEGAEIVADYIRNMAEEKAGQGFQVRILCAKEHAALYPAEYVRTIGELAHDESIAHNLYRCLREFDQEKVEFVFSEAFDGDELGEAVMNRLIKAAGYHIITAKSKRADTE